MMQTLQKLPSNMSKKREETKRKHTVAALPQKHMLWGIVAVTVLALLFIVSLSLRHTVPTNEPFVTQANDPGSLQVRHPLTGTWMSPGAELPSVFAVMIDNHEDARPQSGLDQAFLVIEAPVEGGIPRMMALFDAQTSVEKIGPVRSARPYFIDWAQEFDALYAHVGGSDEALEKIVSGGTFDLNEFSHGSSFWRALSRLAPHNAYTSSELLNAFLQNRNEAGVAPEVLYESWKFKDPAEDRDLQAVSHVAVDFWAPTYRIDWNFDSATNRYLRSQNGTLDNTLEGNQVQADNVVLVVTDVDVLDGVGHRKIRTTGEGSAWVMQDGIVIEATWKKASASQRLRFYRGEEEIGMNPGSTWIEVVPSVYDLTFEPE